MTGWEQARTAASGRGRVWERRVWERSVAGLRAVVRGGLVRENGSRCWPTSRHLCESAEVDARSSVLSVRLGTRHAKAALPHTHTRAIRCASESHHLHSTPPVQVEHVYANACGPHLHFHPEARRPRLRQGLALPIRSRLLRPSALHLRLLRAALRRPHDDREQRRRGRWRRRGGGDERKAGRDRHLRGFLFESLGGRARRVEWPAEGGGSGHGCRSGPRRRRVPRGEVRETTRGKTLLYW